MNAEDRKAVEEICRRHGKAPGRLMDIAIEVQERLRSVGPEAVDAIAGALSMPRVDVEGLVSFYAFLGKPRGRIAIRLCDDIIDRQNGLAEVAAVLSEAFGIPFGRVTPDGLFSLEYTPCIGLSDQAPAALVNDVPVTHLTPSGARELARDLKRHQDPRKLVRTFGDGKNAHPLVQSMVVNNLRRRRGEVIFTAHRRGDGLRKALSMRPAEVIRDMKTSRLRGRGGAGFPVGMKWEFTRKADGERKVVMCNADEGEPGTFKDRVLLTECPELLVEGMCIAAYAIGAEEGILYLRSEYSYLRAYLEDVLAGMRQDGLLGARILGREFSFDVRIQMGAGAYVCGEETALISSCEGRRGDPKNRPPFPAQKGYQGRPTSVNNVETLCCVARILDEGAGWFLGIGTKTSPGTKVLCVSGDCRMPGVYEVPFGIKVSEVLEMAGADEPAAVQVGGPSGRMLFPKDFGRTIDYDDLATGGSVMVFNHERDLLEVVRYFTEFFVDESCGYCTPCRMGNTLIKERLDRILAGRGERADLDYLRELGASIKAASRCGLGQTSPNPVLSTLEGGPELYEKRLVRRTEQGLQAGFDLGSALKEAEAIARRRSVHAEP